MKRWALALGGIAAVGGLYIANRQPKVPVLLVEFEFNAEGTKGLFETPMPVDGQVCTVQDLNHANEPPAKPVADYWDIEGRNRVIVLDAAGKAAVIYEVPSYFAANGEQPVDTKSYCEVKNKDVPIQLVVEDYNRTSNWWMTLN